MLTCLHGYIPVEGLLQLVKLMPQLFSFESHGSHCIRVQLKVMTCFHGQSSSADETVSTHSDDELIIFHPNCYTYGTGCHISDWIDSHQNEIEEIPIYGQRKFQDKFTNTPISDALVWNISFLLLAPSQHTLQLMGVFKKGDVTRYGW